MGDTPNNWPNYLLGTNAYKDLNLVDNYCLQSTSTTSVISKWGTFPLFLSLIILLLVLPGISIASGFKSSR